MKILLFLLSCFSVAAGYGQIIECPSFSVVESHLTSDTILLLDIDDTLLITKQMLGCDEWFVRRLKKHQEDGMRKREALEASLAEWEAVRHLTRMEIVEPGSEEIVQRLQNAGYCIMGMTTQGLALATRTVLHLQEQQIDLMPTAPSAHDHYLTYGEHGILYRMGILFTSGTHKGEVLFQLLDRLQVMPGRIVFLNDKATHLREVEEVAEARGVEFVGLRYAYSDGKKARFSPRIADLQFRYSTLDHLLSDEEVMSGSFGDPLHVD